MTLYILGTYLVTLALGFIVGIHTGRGAAWDAHVESAVEQARQRHPSSQTPPGAAAAPTPPLGNDRGAGRTS